MKTVTLEVASRGEVTRRALEAFRGRKQRARLSFATPELLWRVLTAKRWAILTTMAGQGPLTIAYVVGGFGTATTYVEPFPPTGVTYEVPHRMEAAHPVWMPTGRSLMFQDYADLWQVEVETKPSFRCGPARSVQRGGAILSTAFARRNMAVIPGANSFVAVVPPERQGASPIAAERHIDVVLNWQAALRQQIPAR